MAKIDPYLKTALELIADNGWEEFTLTDLAKKRQVKLATIHQHFPSRISVIEAFARYVDQQMLDSLESFSADESLRDRLFSVIMTRLDALSPYKAVIRSLWSEGWKDPQLLLCSLPLGLNSMSWILQAAGIDTSGLLGTLRIKTFTLFYINSIRNWLQDQSETLDETMVSIDRDLSRLAQFPSFYN